MLAARCWGTEASRAAAARLLDRHASWGADLGPGEAFLLGAPSAHQSALFVEVLAGGEDRTLDAVGRPHGLSGPAVGDAALRAGRRIRSVLQDAPPPWPWLVAELRCRLGLPRPKMLGDALAQPGAAPGAVAALLAAWLAGPYRWVRGRPGWIARDPAVLLARSARCVRADGGVRLLTDVADELADLEPDAPVRACLDQRVGLRRLDRTYTPVLTMTDLRVDLSADDADTGTEAGANAQSDGGPEGG